MQTRKFRPFRAVAASVAVAGLLTAAACGQGGRGDSDEGGTDGEFRLGTIETVTAMDPAGSYDLGSWTMQYNIFEQLVRVPAGETEPVGDAAESCEYTDAKTVECKLREGLTFSNGNELTSSDVEYSFRRNIEIADPNGSSVLLGSISNGDEKKPSLAEGAIETPDDQTVVFHLNQPDQTFIHVLSGATASIVDEDTYPADELLPDDQAVGSGPYTLAQYNEGEQATLNANDDYDGERTPNIKTVFVQYFSDPTPLRNAISSDQVDIAWRSLSPTDLSSLEEEGNVNVVRGEGSEFRYWVWQFSQPNAKEKSVRQAVAQIMDRDAIAENAYDGTVDPSYSIVPQGFAGATTPFEEKYGSPDVDKAEKLLKDAGIKTPVELVLGYTPTHYGPNAVDEANELAGQLNDSGLFKVTTEDAEWEQYQTDYKKGAYDLFHLGWFPDLLDADNYLTPFLRDGGFYENNYSSQKVNGLLDQELGETDKGKREGMFGELQDIVAEDVPLIPSWTGQNVAVTSKDLAGVENTLDPTYIFRFWEIEKS